MSDEGLAPEVRRLLLEARANRLSYALRVLASPDSPPRLVVALGEAHVKLAAASELGKRIVDAFELRGVEGFEFRRVAAGHLLWFFIYVPRLLLRVVTFGRVKGSTIYDAKRATHGRTIALEKPERVPWSLHFGSVYLTIFFLTAFCLFVATQVPGAPPWLVSALAAASFVFEVHMLALVPAWMLRRRPWSWLVHPAITILTVRDTLMADGTVRMLRDHPDENAALVIMGRAHLAGYERELVESWGFAPLEI